VHLLKIILFANTDWYLYNYRMPLALELRARGHEPILMSPDGNYHARLEQQGLRWICFPFSRQGRNPLQELNTIWRLRSLYKEEKPSVVHHFTIKCVLYGSIAGRMSGIPRIINAVPGLGYVFSRDRNKVDLLQYLVKTFYRFALRGTTVVFQNPDDQALFVDEKLVKGGQYHLIMGSGVDLERFKPQPEPVGDIVVILPSRMLWSKGVMDFIEAGRILRNAGVRGRFVLAGAGDPGNPEAVSQSQLEDWQQQGDAEWWGWTDDAPSLYHKAHIVCLPSTYGEGVPRSLVEACASGRPVVTTDMPGCREVVRDGENGFLVKPHDPQGLSVAIRRLIDDPALRQEMGKRGRLIAAQEFSQQKVLDETIKLYA
jgi:glycosyltransferase involved in cell wall biosynthesis